ncbi:uncharacterized protein [Anabrus simplex]|uniref:uncharacterized protein n=1 Tax=Anabrus simplex TaxID=316456 RepID=UPI0035A31C66
MDRADIHHIELIRSPRQTRVQVHLAPPHTIPMMRPPPPHGPLIRPFRSPPLISPLTTTSSPFITPQEPYKVNGQLPAQNGVSLSANAFEHKIFPRNPPFHNQPAPPFVNHDPQFHSHKSTFLLGQQGPNTNSIFNQQNANNHFIAPSNHVNHITSQQQPIHQNPVLQNPNNNALNHISPNSNHFGHQGGNTHSLFNANQNKPHFVQENSNIPSLQISNGHQFNHPNFNNFPNQANTNSHFLSQQGSSSNNNGGGNALPPHISSNNQVLTPGNFNNHQGINNNFNHHGSNNNIKNSNSYVPDLKYPHIQNPVTTQPFRWEDHIQQGTNTAVSIQQPLYRNPESVQPFPNISLFTETSFRKPESSQQPYPYFGNNENAINPVTVNPPSNIPNQVRYNSQFLTTSASGVFPQVVAPTQSAKTVDTRAKATLKEVLSQDCADHEEYGFCASPPRYPSHQVTQVIRQCREVLRALYVPVPGSNLSQPKSSKLENMERANREVWSWANGTSTAVGERRAACSSDAARVLPGYVRDAVSGRWFVVVQAAGHVVQPISVDVCRSPNKPCSGVNKCTRSGSFRHAYKASRCEQRFTYHHLVTWDPDTPEACPRLTVASFPTACVCQLETL